MSLDANANRFSGFADLYDAVRPVPPATLADVITHYAGGDHPAVVVDLGCGTGLSTRWAAGWSSEVIGVEPSDDMRVRAATVTDLPHVRYVAGWSNATDLADGSADIVLAVQALHWMEPSSTFTEVARILRPGGVFAALDCDWPPSVGNAAAEQAWHTARATVAVHERRMAGWASNSVATRTSSSSPQTDELRPTDSGDPAAAVTITDGVQFWHKGEHLRRMIASQQFHHCVEIAALSEQRGDADRFVQLFKSQGDYQALRRHGLDDATLGVDRFSDEARAILGSAEHPFWFTYRARIGVRPKG
ncbi:MAG: class I SAM-dependent methyltransferase [Ilumatobacteraceae bacterium]|nr:class I SAM-dependent methyltransferase [Ilumatobacteraceae bacterium]